MGKVLLMKLHVLPNKNNTVPVGSDEDDGQVYIYTRGSEC